MKSEHRHELKTNELAEWLSNLPQWGKDNLGTIIIVIAAIGVVAGFFGWKSISKKVQSGEHEEFTTMLDSTLGMKAEIVRQQMSSQRSDISYILLNKATDLEVFAGKTENKNIAAMALVKAADSIRSELQYRNVTIEQKDMVERINKAKKDYTEAIAKNPPNKTIKGLAEFGLGLCAEELGDFDEAHKIYNGIIENTEYAGTIILNKAEVRLNTMDDYKQNVVFRSFPAMPIPGPNDVNNVLDPLTELMRDANENVGDANLPLDIDSSDANLSEIMIDSAVPVEANLPIEINFPSDINSLEQ